MTEGTTDILGLATVEAGDKLPQGVTKENFEILDGVQPVLSLVNGEGATLVAGDVVLLSSSATFFVNPQRGIRTVIGVLQQTTPDGETGLIKVAGKVDALKVDRTTAIGDWLIASGDSGNRGAATPEPKKYTPPRGTFAIALSAITGAGLVEAYLIPSPTTSDYEQAVEEHKAISHTSVLSAYGPSPSITIVNDYDLGNGWVAVVDGGAITNVVRSVTGTPEWLFTTGNVSNQDVGAVLFPTVGNGSSTNPQLKISGRLDSAGSAGNLERFIGFSGSAGTFGDVNDIIGFRTIGTGDIEAVCDTGGTETAVDTGKTGGSLEIVVTGEPNPIARFYINSILEATITTNIPSAVALFAQVGVRTKTTAARAMNTMGVAVSVSAGSS